MPTASISKPIALDSNALTNTEIINKKIDTVVGIWDLSNTTAHAPESTFACAYEVEGAKTGEEIGVESVIGTDDRVTVNPSDFAEGGKYRSIVKLFLLYEGQGEEARKNENSWGMGTGWLIAPDLIVTAGHCSYDWSHKFGKLIAVKAYIGYNGKSSIPNASVQFRQGKRIAAPAEWLKGPSRTYDVSFIMVDSPFKGIKPFKFEDTPAKGELNIGVVGYPGDRDRGEYMLKHYLDTKFDLAKTQKMLSYQIDTYGGNSGSPVLRSTDSVAIGVHCYGGSINQASVIGPLGNVFSDYIQAVRTPVSGKTTPQGIRFFSVSSTPTPSKVGSKIGSSGSLGTAPVSKNKPIAKRNILPSKYSAVQEAYSPRGYNGAESSNGHGNGSSNDEGFLDDLGGFLKKGLQIGAPIIGGVLNTASPFLGPVGAPIGALAGVAIGALGKFAAESAMGTESSVDPSESMQGLAERAVLGEAALQAIMAMDKEMLHEAGVFDEMNTVVQKLAPAVKKAAPHVMGVIMPAALNIAAVALNQAKQNPGAESAFSTEWPVREYTLRNSSNVPVNYENSDVEAFAAQLIESARDNGDDTEGFLQVISAGLSKTGKVLEKVAKIGIPIFLDHLAKTESAMPSGPGAEVPQLQGLAERAVLQEAALQAVLTLPPQVLEDEGFFDIMKNVIKKVAPVVLDAAPSIIKAVGPLVSSAIGAESFTVNNPKIQNRNGNRSLNKKRSVARFAAGASESDFLEKLNGWTPVSY